MSTKNSLVAFLFLASSVWSQQQVAATGLQTPHTVSADKGVPFKGNLEGVATITPIAPQFLSALTKGTFNATHLCRFTAIRAQIVNTVASTSFGSFAITAPNVE